jgi:hypothetical protein
MVGPLDGSRQLMSVIPIQAPAQNPAFSRGARMLRTPSK